MLSLRKLARLKHRGVVLIVAMIFLVIFSALAVSMTTLVGTNVQIASNQHKINSAFLAAQSGLECGKYIVANIHLPSTPYNTVTTAQANQTWSILCSQVQGQPWISGQVQKTSTEIITPATSFGDTNASFQVRFYRIGTHTIKLEGIGSDGQISKQVCVDMIIQKDRDVLNYAIASRGRMWLTGQSLIRGDIFSAWDRPEISPYNITKDPVVLGTINTVLTLEQIQQEGYQLEALDVNDNPIYANGAPLGSNYEERYYGPFDKIHAYHAGISYGRQYENMVGMDISDYNTDIYNFGLTIIPPCPSGLRKVEYFPHALLSEGGYSMPRDGMPYNTPNRKLKRHVYQNQTFTNALLPNNYNALFKNCTFQEVLYIDCSKTGSPYYNNVRFEDCTFSGVIISDVPEVFKWMHNCLYFTGEATFENTSSIQEATILAPHFNVNLGNTNPQQTENNVITGAIVGGIVDVRGNAQIYGTIISMCDTTQWSWGNVTNIGATLDDGGSETTELGDIEVISITPNPDQMLPSGITSPIIIKPLQETYSEGV